MTETITIQGTEYQVLRHTPVADLPAGCWQREHYTRIGAKGQVSLLRGDDPNVWTATERGDGTIGQPTNTRLLPNGASTRTAHPSRARRTL